MGRKKKAAQQVAAAVMGPCPMTEPHRGARPTLRLIAVREMDAERQRRFELLIQTLLRRWAARGGTDEGET